MKSSYIVFAKYAGRVQQIRTVKCNDPSSEKISKLGLPGEKPVAFIGHYIGKLTPEKAGQVIRQRRNLPELFRKNMPLPFTEQEIGQMRAAADFRGGAEKLMLELRLWKNLEEKTKAEKERLFNDDIKPALQAISLKEAAIIILASGLKDGDPVMISKLAKMFGLTRGSIERIIREATAKMFGSISLSRVGRQY